MWQQLLKVIQCESNRRTDLPVVDQIWFLEHSRNLLLDQLFLIHNHPEILSRELELETGLLFNKSLFLESTDAINDLLVVLHRYRTP